MPACETHGVTHDDIDELADRLFSAIQAGDIDAVADTYADDAIIWHNSSTCCAALHPAVRQDTSPA
ncbi:MAG: hypothetical protein JWN99_2436 [Ilumatobacteraceae bacterium]|nr:hypothetical protein [Ilumatobacteraceae bacterium]